jgi:hypothetical protein
MPDILHKVGIKSSSLHDVYQAFDHARRSCRLVDERHARGQHGRPDEWVGTKVSWELKREGDYAVVLFKHQGWKEPVEFMHHCSTKWGVFLMSLKSLLETGTGAPAPHDIKIDNWN